MAMVSWGGARISLSRGSVLSREYFPSSSDILQNAPFRSQIFEIFFASGGKGALIPLTRILRTFLVRVLYSSVPFRDRAATTRRLYRGVFYLASRRRITMPARWHRPLHGMTPCTEWTPVIYLRNMYRVALKLVHFFQHAISLEPFKI